MSSGTPSGCGSMKDKGIEGVNFALIGFWNMEEESILTTSTEALQNNKISILNLAWVICPKLPQESRELSSLSSVCP